MRACQAEVRGVMIKCGRLPGCTGVALSAIMAEISRRVVWVACLLKIILVTLITIRK